MLTSYVAGNLLGRLLMSYLIVWLVCLGFAKGNWRAAFARTGRWYAVLGTIIVFVLGLLGSLGARAGGAI